MEGLREAAPRTMPAPPPPAAGSNHKIKRRKQRDDVEPPPFPPRPLDECDPTKNGAPQDEAGNGGTTGGGTATESRSSRRSATKKPKSRRNDDNPHYRGMSYEAVPSSGRPGTPHRFFAASYQTTAPRLEQLETNDNGGSGSGNDNDMIAGQLPTVGGVTTLWPVLHRNANGLVVVTAVPPSTFLTRLEAVSSSSPGQIPQVRIVVTSGEKAGANTAEGPDATATPAVDDEESPKRVAVAASAGAPPRPQQGGVTALSATAVVVRPTDTLAVVAVRDADGVDRTVAVVPCGVSGTVVEVNDALTWEKWLHDPLLNGYFAVVRPIGPFPPPLPRQQQQQQQQLAPSAAPLGAAADRLGNHVAAEKAVVATTPAPA